ncbi:MAG: hypothetical protein DBX58_04935 [Clostridiales bacterium]|nr:MAG: hypothetical protein DBX58_04935 [Clostridiales bacterium]
MKRRKRWLLSGFIVMLLFLAVGLFTVSPAGRISSKHEYIISKYYRFEPLSENGIEQWFIPEYNYLDAIELFIANVYEESEGEILLEIENENGKRIFRRSYRASDIAAGEFVKYSIKKNLKEKERYKIRISYTGDTSESDMVPVLMISEKSKNLSETQEAFSNGQELDYNVALTYHYAQKKWFSLS